MANSLCSNYHFFERERIAPGDIQSALCGYDRYVSAYNLSPRVKDVFEMVSAKEKHWLIFQEYRIEPLQMPNVGVIYEATGNDEAEVLLSYFDRWPVEAGERICIDATGFIRPHLMFLMRYLYETRLPLVDFIYSEPTAYAKGVGTPFSAHLTEVRQVRGFEGAHSLEPEGDYFVIGCGYDTKAMQAAANHLKQALKVQMFPFPPLRPHMYQENRLKTQDCQDAFGHVFEQIFAPGYDPFATADALSRFTRSHRMSIKNLYLTPLATKPQVMGFVWFYLMECLKEPVSIMFPYSNGYNQETSTGLSEIWRFRMDFDLLRSLQCSFRA